MSPLPDADHVARYCKPSTIDESGLPMASAFAMRHGEDHLSVNWLEYFDPRPGVAVYCVREALAAKSFQLRQGGRMAVLNVGMIKTAVKRHLGRSLHINHLPSEGDPSHAGIFGYAEVDFMVAAEMRTLVGPANVRRAV